MNNSKSKINAEQIILLMAIACIIAALLLCITLYAKGDSLTLNSAWLQPSFFSGWPLEVPPLPHGSGRLFQTNLILEFWTDGESNMNI